MKRKLALPNYKLPPNPQFHSTTVLREVASAVHTKNGCQTKVSGLERLSIPSWDGSRKTYITWKKEFNHWMSKYEQDKDEVLQRFRRALPRGSWWAEQEIDGCAPS